MNTTDDPLSAHRLRARQSNTTVRARLRVDSVGPTLPHRRPGDCRTRPNRSERYRRWWHANCGRFAHHERDRVLHVRSCDRLPPPYLYGGRNTLLVLSTLFWFTSPLLQMGFFDAVLFYGFYACRFYGTSHVSVSPPPRTAFLRNKKQVLLEHSTVFMSQVHIMLNMFKGETKIVIGEP